MMEIQNTIARIMTSNTVQTENFQSTVLLTKHLQITTLISTIFTNSKRYLIRTINNIKNREIKDDKLNELSNKI